MDHPNAGRRADRTARRCGAAALAAVLMAGPAVARAQTDPAAEAVPASPAVAAAPVEPAPEPTAAAPAPAEQAAAQAVEPAAEHVAATSPAQADAAAAPAVAAAPVEETPAARAVVAPAARPAPAGSAAEAPAPAAVVQAPVALEPDAPAPAPAVSQAPGASPRAPLPRPAIPVAQVRLTGSSTVGDRLVPDLVDAHLSGEKLQAGGWVPGEAPNQRVQGARGAEGAVRVTVTLTSTPEAFAALNAKQAEVAMSSRPVSDEEAAAFRAAFGAEAAGAAPREHVVALDGVAVIVNTENPVQKLRLDQIREIYAGNITKWSAVGGPDLPIRLHTRDPAASGTAGFFNAAVMRRRAVAASAQRMESYDAIAGAVAGEIGAIGLVPFAFVGRNRALGLELSCGIEHGADEFALKTEDYPLSRRLYLYAAPQPGEQAARFLRFAGSAAAYDVVRDAGYVSLQPVPSAREHAASRLEEAGRAKPAAADGRYAEALRDYADATRDARRLSATFRFATGSAQLEARAHDDLERVAEFLRRPENAALRVSVLGFTDGSGPFGQNRAMSNGRANEVAAQLRQRGVRVAQAKGFGPVAPVACDDDPNTAVRNRRVEIWLGE